MPLHVPTRGEFHAVVSGRRDRSRGHSVDLWIATYMYRCVAHFLSASNGGNVTREHNSLMKKESCTSEGHAERSGHLSKNEGSPSRTPDGDQRHVHFGDVAVIGSGEYSWEEHGGECLQDARQFPDNERHGKGNSQDGTASDQDRISFSSRKGEEPLIVSDST
ncbi:hypothetical protein F3Y22_tig00112261pilonHSYRG00080 [Hibiscus syriacus]|uniref:Uncharacterized protein n=1 Tax=Hibiscus syriacus TaxID=106335 RepID=A0A6A2YC59_HIBSY|nr:hypothetical protein F3Y22_tig00112261pilonHSYRG00080 [Hibiscus syriacus]